MYKDSMGFILLTSLVQSDKSQEERVKTVYSEIEELLDQYKGVFMEPTELPPKRNCDHAIPLKEDSGPPNIRPYRVPHQQKEELEKQVKQLLDSAIIKPSESPYASPAILVRKKDGTWRMCNCALTTGGLMLKQLRTNFPYQ